MRLTVLVAALLASACAAPIEDGGSAAEGAQATTEGAGAIAPETSDTDAVVVGYAGTFAGLDRLHYAVLRGVLSSPSLKKVRVVQVGSEEAARSQSTLLPRPDGSGFRLERVAFDEAFARERASGRLTTGGVATDSIWVRDYFPLTVKRGTARTLVKFRYVHRLAPDNGRAGRETAQRLGFSVLESPLALDGGNVLVDDDGTFYSTTRVLEDNADVGKEGVETELRRVLGVRDFVWFSPMRHEDTRHVDMFAKVVGPRKVVVAASNFRGGDAGDARAPHLDEVAETFRARGFEVTRIQSAEGEADRRPLSYVNALVVGKTMFVPQYFEPMRVEALAGLGEPYARARLACTREHPARARADETESQATFRAQAACVLGRLELAGEPLGAEVRGQRLAFERDAEALSAYRALGFDAVPVPTLDMIELAGAVHCLTMQISR